MKKEPFYGYTPKQTQAWVDKAPQTPPKEFQGVAKATSLDDEQLSQIDKEYLLRAIKLASHNPMQAFENESPDGGLFGAVLYKDGKILGEGWNTVLKEGDPTRHAEMNAIRQATHDNAYGLQELEGATLYTSGAPCPMCYAAMAWANVKSIIYASDYADALKYGGFRDAPISDSLALPLQKRELSGVQANSGLARQWWEFYNWVVYKDAKGSKY